MPSRNPQSAGSASQQPVQRCRLQNTLAKVRRLPLRQGRPLQQGQAGEKRQQIQCKLCLKLELMAKGVM
jgi:Eukaryotic translation initiation factor eIF2A